jgi:hypothetical protein
MVDGQASDLYASNTDTRSATSSIYGSGEEPAVDSQSPLQIPYSLGASQVVSRVISRAMRMFCFMLVSA